jgi:hypothetical protein
MKHVMVDLETLGNLADSIILSIGAVKFDLESQKYDDDGFYASISIDSNVDLGRKPVESTVVWWLGQSKEAQAVFHEPKQPLEEALRSLSEWLGHNKRLVWSNGADFDIPMLNHAYSQIGLLPPWEFWNSRCVRTYKSLPAAARVPKPENDHNALRDAFSQVRYVQAIHAAMTGKVVA